MTLTAEEAQIGKRIQLVRKECGLNQTLTARQIGLSRDQLKRIERGEAAVRFLPAFLFCYFTRTSPLWLAFGQPEKRFGFFGVRPIVATEDPAVTFLEVMQRNRARFRNASVSRVHNSRVEHLEAQIVSSSLKDALNRLLEKPKQNVGSVAPSGRKVRKSKSSA
jgi:transcriptional regulator with XRE-family HTH domain